jgi:hypothetical protein
MPDDRAHDSANIIDIDQRADELLGTDMRRRRRRPKPRYFPSTPLHGDAAALWFLHVSM